MTNDRPFDCVHSSSRKQKRKSDLFLMRRQEGRQRREGIAGVYQREPSVAQLRKSERHPADRLYPTRAGRPCLREWTSAFVRKFFPICCCLRIKAQTAVLQRASSKRTIRRAARRDKILSPHFLLPHVLDSRPRRIPQILGSVKAHEWQGYARQVRLPPRGCGRPRILFAGLKSSFNFVGLSELLLGQNVSRQLVRQMLSPKSIE